MANATPQPSNKSDENTTPATPPLPAPDPVTVPVPEDESESYIVYGVEGGKTKRVRLSTYRKNGLG